MHKTKMLMLLFAGLMVPLILGCDEETDRRLAEMAESQLAQQAEMNRDMVDLHRDVTAGTRELVEADALSRQEFVELHHDMQAERIAIGEQRDELEEDRRQLAEQRRTDPVIAEAIQNVGLLLACLLPLLLCWRLLQRPADSADDHLVTEILLEDLTADQPLLLPAPQRSRRKSVEYREEGGAQSDPTGVDPDESCSTTE